ncbi:MAG: tetratricopeptide repeat protein [Terriglobales bacterium]|jgi:tetratricopeptide (TPR) repeat protein
MEIPAQDPGLSSSPAKRTLLLCLLLIGVTLTVYFPVTHNAFINFDDDSYITDNDHVQAGLTWPTVKWSFATFEMGNWHPLTWLSHALDCELFGLHAGEHHLVNALLHAINAAVLFLLLQSATGFTARSLMVAALFALHPVNVESVAWAAERKTVLSTFFFLLALLAYGWYARQPKVSRYALVFLLFLLALMSKPQAIPFPFLLLLWDYWPLRRMATSSPPPLHNLTAAAPQRPNASRFSFTFLVLEKQPLLLLAVASAVVTLIAQHAAHALRPFAAHRIMFIRIENALISYVRYVAISIWPSGLTLFYPHPTKLFPAWQVGAAAVALVFATVIALSLWRARPYLAVGWLWFLVSMVPMIGLLQVGQQARADRYAYISFIGLFVIAVWTVADWARRAKVPRASVAVAAAVILVALSVATHRQIGFWRNTPTAWLRALAVTQNNFVAHTGLAIYLDQQGQTEEAALHFRAALAIDPDHLPAVLGLGACEHQRGNLPAAIERYKTVALHPGDPYLRSSAYTGLGSAYRQMGDYPDAQQSYQSALQLSPARPDALVGLGLVAQHDGDLAAAIQQFSDAIAVAPTDIAYLLLAHALEQAGRSAEAQAARQRASLISPDLDQAQKQADALLAGRS